MTKPDVETVTPVTKPNVETVTPVTKPNVEAVTPVTKPDVETVTPVTKPNVEAVTPVTKPNVETVTPVTKPNVETVTPVTKPDVEAVTPVTKPNVETVTPVTKPNVEAIVPQKKEPVYSEITARVKAERNTITVTITGGSSEAMYISVGDDVRTGLHKGDSAVFRGLAAGEYDIEVDYMKGTNVFRTTAAIQGRQPAAEVTPKPNSGNGSSQVELITPRPNHGNNENNGGSQVELITPKPNHGNNENNGGSQVELITPKPNHGSNGNYGSNGNNGGGLVELITPKPDHSTSDQVNAFAIQPVVADGEIGVIVHGASRREVEVVVLDARGRQVAANGIIGSGFVKMGSFVTGTYTVRAQYVTPVQDKYGNYDHMTVTAKAVVPGGYEGSHRPERPVNIEAKVETGTDYIVVTVTRATNTDMIVSVSGQKNKSINEGGSVRFEGLTPGKSYDIEVDYKIVVEGTTPFRTSVTLPKEKDYPTFERGDRGDALIYALQQRLKDLGYYTIKVDGIYGSGTQRAVRMFQQENGLKVTGKADSATQKLLYSSAAKPAGSHASDHYDTLSRSSKYRSAVVPLQRRLKALGYYTGSVDGYFGSGTYRAVRNFQSRNGLKVTGVADPYTQQVLYSSSAKAASGSSSSSSSSSTGYRLLYWGCRGDAVVRLQQALIDAGYKSIVRAADGIYGQWTYDAVRAYQKDHGLAVDGIAGKNTQNSLYGTSY